MKIINKVFALVLALFTLISVLPLSVFASDAWADVDATTDGDASKVTITLDAGTLAEILERDGISSELLQSLQSGISVDLDALRSAFSEDDLFDIIPRDRWSEVFDVGEILEELSIQKGGLENVVKDYIDITALLEEVMEDETRIEELAELLMSIDDLETCFNDALLIKEHYLVPDSDYESDYALLLDYVRNKEAMIEMIAEDPDDRAVLLGDLERIVSAYTTVDEFGALFDVAALLEDGVLTALDLIAPNAAEIVKAKLLHNTDPNFDVLDSRYINYVGLFDAVAHDQDALNDVLGMVDIEDYEQAIRADYVDIASMIRHIDLAETMKRIMNDASKEDLENGNIIKFDVLFSKEEVSADKLVEIFTVKAIFTHLKDGALNEIVNSINLGEKLQPVLALVLDRVLENVNNVVINGYKVASDDTSATGKLEIYADQLITAIEKSLPSLTDFINIDDGKIMTMNVVMDYNVDESVDANKTEKTKNITFELVIDGDISRLQSAASKLQDLLDNYINELKITPDSVVIDLNAPNSFSILYGEILDPSKIEDQALREKIMNVVNLDGDDLIGFIGDELTFDELIEVLNAVDPSALYERLKAETLLETCLAKLDSALGKDFSSMNLNETVKYIASNESTLESVCEAIEARTGRDVLALLEKLSVKADGFIDEAEERDAIAKMLSAVESGLNIDVSNISVEDILNRGKDTPILEKVSQVVASKVGADVREVLLNNSADEIYATAVAKLAEREDAYNKVRNYLVTVLQKLPDSLMNVSINDLYEQEGVFGKSGSITYNPKSILEKAVNKLLEKVNISKVDQVAKLLLECIADSEVTTEVDVSVNFADLRRITFKTRDGKTELLNAYLPIGTTLDVFKNPDNTAGYVFKGWAAYDENNEVIAVDVMPNHDVVVYADLHMIEVTFQTPDHKDLGKIVMEQGKTLADVQDELNEILALITEKDTTQNEKLYADQKVDWYRGEEKVDSTTTVLKDGDVLVYGLTPNWFLNFGDAAIDYDVTLDGDKYTIIVYGDLPADGFTLDMDRAHLLEDALDNSGVELALNVEPTNGTSYTFLAFSNDILRTLGGEASETVTFTYAPTTVGETAFADIYSEAKGVVFHSFQIKADNEEFSSFGGGLTVKVPFDWSSTASRTTVYTFDADGKLEEVNSSKEEIGFIEFNPTHFSDFMVADEYVLEYVFVDENGKTLASSQFNYYPEGADVPWETVTSPDSKYTILKVMNGNTELGDNADFLMPAEKATLTVVLSGRTYYVYYYVNGELQKDWTQEYEAKDVQGFEFRSFDDVIALNQAPAGYKNAGEWVGDKTLLGKQDIYLYAQYEIKTFTVRFVDTNKNVNDSDYVVYEISGVTYENKDYTYVEPDVPEKKGYLGSWDTAHYQIDGTVITVSATYAPLTFPIIPDQNVTVSKNSATVGEEITVTVTPVDGKDAKVTVNGVEITNGKFIMPNETAYVTVTYTPKTYTYTINGVSGTGKFGDTVKVPEIVVKPGEYLASISDNCYLVSYTRESDGTLKLNYAFELKADNTAIQYEVKSTPLAVIQILNGKLFNGSGDPESNQPNVKFNGWSEKVANVLSFATFSLTRTPASLLWLWILLGVLLFIALVVLIYVLHITGKIGVNFITRFAVWLVGLFFALCLAVAALGLKIAHLFGKSDDPEDYGFTEVEPKAAPAEETTEENAENSENAENTDTATEAPAEENSVENTEAAAVEEKTAEEASVEEPAVEEAPATETSVEDAAVAKAVAETVEEVVAEEAPVEETVAEEAPVEEAVVEEVPAEETVAEEAPVEEAVVEEVPVEEAVAEETPVEETVAEEAPVEEAVAEEAPVEEAVAEEAPAEEAVVEEAPVEEAVAEEAPAEEAVAEETPAEEDVTEEASDDETKNNK